VGLLLVEVVADLGAVTPEGEGVVILPPRGDGDDGVQVTPLQRAPVVSRREVHDGDVTRAATLDLVNAVGYVVPTAE
jgi:hypothetical protein